MDNKGKEVLHGSCSCKEDIAQETDLKPREGETPVCVAVNNTSETPAKTRPEKLRKKDDKSVEHVLKALNSLNTTEEKLAAMCKKYADIFDENRKLQLMVKQTEKRCSVLQREKEQLQTEHSKAILTRSRLENLCRELQRQNKAIKDESLLRIREEEEKRKEVSAKFQNTLSEITALMQQNNDKNNKLRDDNIDMTAKLKNVCEQYELREQQVEKISKQMQLEAQLADAKIAKVKMEMAAEKEILLREKQQLLMDLTQYQARCQEFQATEVNLRNQISMYNDKYDEFQKALARSNDVFSGFKTEMEKMSKKICKLEKETSSWKQRWELSHSALLEMAADKQKSEQELGIATRQLATLQNLCRTLQADRTTLLGRLKQTMVSPDSGETTAVSNTAQENNQPSISEIQQVESIHNSLTQDNSTTCNQNVLLLASQSSEESTVSKGDIIESDSVTTSDVKQSTDQNNTICKEINTNEKTETNSTANDNQTQKELSSPDPVSIQCAVNQNSSVTNNIHTVSELVEPNLAVNDTQPQTDQNNTDVNVSVNDSHTTFESITGGGQCNSTNNISQSDSPIVIEISDIPVVTSESKPVETNAVNSEIIVGDKCQTKDNNSRNIELNGSVEITATENVEVPSSGLTETSNTSPVTSDKEGKSPKQKVLAEGKKGKESSKKKKK